MWRNGWWWISTSRHDRKSLPSGSKTNCKMSANGSATSLTAEPKLKKKEASGAIKALCRVASRGLNSPSETPSNNPIRSGRNKLPVTNLYAKHNNSNAVYCDTSNPIWARLARVTDATVRMTYRTSWTTRASKKTNGSPRMAVTSDQKRLDDFDKLSFHFSVLGRRPFSAIVWLNLIKSNLFNRHSICNDPHDLNSGLLFRDPIVAKYLDCLLSQGKWRLWKVVANG